ncbi:hypothetical protein COU58_03070 [Candidatus Pacearchaeota archaeon CG10_big_fil_rev_8_21_14_0_10_32_42]|nr:MAG: hypothetical protein COU58_03070 [Candidatus Pacearchaeota archaeon CG10_big_fil_rev_8_21_14_0_10_32_42]
MIDEIKDFYEKTKFKVGQVIEWVDDFGPPINWIKIFFKTYPRMRKVEFKISDCEREFCRLLEQRKSIRDFEGSPISFDSLNRIIHYSVGIKDSKESLEHTRRYYPSAGARYPIETYIINNNVDRLKKGLYHYNVKQNQLEQLLERNLILESTEIFGEANKGNPNFIILTGVMSRTEVKYGINAYRFALLEAGHIGQNISLLAEKEKLGCCALGGFDNDKLSKILDISEEDEIPLYAFSLGKPAR